MSAAAIWQDIGASALTLTTPAPVATVKPDTRWQRDPIGFATTVLGVDPISIRWSEAGPEYRTHVWDGTPDPMAVIAESLAAGKDVGVESGTGTGKTYEAGWLVLWFVASFPDALVVTTAPKKDQLTAQLWKEVGRHWPRFKARYPQAETVELRVRMKPGSTERETWAVIGWACGVDAGQASAVRTQGFHAEHMLIVTEETPGIDHAVMTALGNTCVSDHNVRLALGNPDNRDDALHRFCTTPGVVHVRVSSFDHPNVVCGRTIVPGAVTLKGIANLETTWGKGSPMFDSRTRGVSPAQSSEALIRWEWIERAWERWERIPAFHIGKKALGVDVSQSVNGDLSAIAEWQGSALERVNAFPCENATDLGRTVYAKMQLEGIEPRYVGIDPIGVGAATTNILNELTGYRVVPLWSGGKPAEYSERGDGGYYADWMPDANMHLNLRAQMWWQMRTDLEKDRIALPRDEALAKELTTPTYKIRNGRVVVESKDDIRSRLGGRSPDRADAAIYGNWVRHRFTERPADDRYDFSAHSQEAFAVEYERGRRVANRFQQPPAPAVGEEAPLDSVLGAMY